MQFFAGSVRSSIRKPETFSFSAVPYFVNVCVCAYIYIYIYIHMQTYIHIRTYRHVCYTYAYNCKSSHIVSCRTISDQIIPHYTTICDTLDHATIALYPLLLGVGFGKSVALRSSKSFPGLAGVCGMRQSQQRNVPGHLGSRPWRYSKYLGFRVWGLGARAFIARKMQKDQACVTCKLVLHPQALNCKLSSRETLQSAWSMGLGRW